MPLASDSMDRYCRTCGPDSNDASVSEAETLKPSEALDRYLAGRRDDQPACSDSLFGVQADASLPAREHAGDR